MRFLLVIAPLLLLIQPSFQNGANSANATLDDLSVDQLKEQLNIANDKVREAIRNMDMTKDELKRKEDQINKLNGDYEEKKKKLEKLNGEEREKNKVWYEEKEKELKAESEVETAKQQFSKAEEALKTAEDDLAGISNQLEEARKVVIEINQTKAQLDQAQKDLAALKPPKTQEEIDKMEADQRGDMHNAATDIGYAIEQMKNLKCEKDIMNENKQCVNDKKDMEKLSNQLREAIDELPKVEAEIKYFYEYPEKHTTMKNRVDALQKAIGNIPTDLFKAHKAVHELEIKLANAIHLKYPVYIAKFKDQKTLFEKEIEHKEAKDRLDSTPRDIKVYNDVTNIENNMKIVAREVNSTKDEIPKLKEKLEENQKDLETANSRVTAIHDRMTVRAESLKQEKKREEASTTASSNGFPWWIIGVVFGVLILAAAIFGVVSWRKRRQQKAAAHGKGAKNLPPSSANEEQGSGGKSDKANRLPIG